MHTTPRLDDLVVPSLAADLKAWRLHGLEERPVRLVAWVIDNVLGYNIVRIRLPRIRTTNVSRLSAHSIRTPWLHIRL
jgi:hypothetical protein